MISFFSPERSIEICQICNGSTGFLGKETSVNVRKVKEDVSMEKLRAAIKDNNLDEMVVEGKSGAHYVVYADPMK